MLAFHDWLNGFWQASDQVFDDAAHFCLVVEGLILVFELLVELVVIETRFLGLHGNQGQIDFRMSLPWPSLH